MEVAQDSKSTGEQAGQRARVYLEYLIDCPPCPRQDRKHLLPVAAARRRRRPGSTADEPTSRRSLPATPTTDAPAPDFLLDDGLLPRPAEFQRRMSPFRRGHGHERVRRAASATPSTSTENSTGGAAAAASSVVRPRPLRVADELPGQRHDLGGGPEDVDGPRRVSLQQMIKHRRSTSNSSNGSSCCSSTSVNDYQHQHLQQVTVYSSSSSSSFLS